MQSIGLNSEYNMDMGIYSHGVRVRIHGWILKRGNIRGEGRFLLNGPRRILAEGRLR